MQRKFLGKKYMGMREKNISYNHLIGGKGVVKIIL